MSLVSNPFPGMALGPGIPPGWTTTGGSGTVEAFATAPGGIYPPAKWYQFTGSGLQTPLFTPSSSTSTYFGWRIEAGSAVTPTVCVFKAPTIFSPPNDEVVLCQLSMERDHTLSIYEFTGPTLLGNTGALGIAYPGNTWYWIQINILLQQTVVLGVNVLQMTIEVCIEANTVISTGLITTTYPVSNLTSLGINAVQWIGGPAGGSTDLSEVEVDGLGAIPSYPNPGTPFNRISQQPIEAAFLPSTGNVRASQIPIEGAFLPNTANVRISQMVIELMLAASGGVIPEYYKRKSFPN